MQVGNLQDGEPFELRGQSFDLNCLVDNINPIVVKICVVCNNRSPNLMFDHNRVVSTWGNVVLADTLYDTYLEELRKEGLT